MDWVAIVLALALGLVIGAIVGARRAFTLVLSGRSLRTAGASLAALMPETPPTRAAADILAGRVRVLLGSTTYNLPVLPRAASRRWLEQLDARYAALAGTLSKAGTEEVMSTLVAETDGLYDMLLAYDTGGILPARDEIDRTATDAQVLHAVLEVWRALHPLAAGVIASRGATPGGSPARSSTPPRRTGGAPSTSSST